MKDNVSPEEKLLKLIRGQKKEDAAIGKKSPVVAVLADIDLKPNLRSGAFTSSKQLLSLSSVTKVIWVVFAISCVYLIGSFIYPLFGLKEIKFSGLPEDEVAMPQVELKQGQKPYEFYLEGIRGRQIFTSASTQNQQQLTKDLPGEVNSDLIKDITLVGIISGENPQAVIEDKKTQKTYYVTKGQFIGEFEVKDIQKGKIILNYKDQKYELYI